MTDLHSAAGNASPACNCFGQSGTNPGCPAHGNHAATPAESAVDGPTDPGAGEDASGPGWDRETIEHFASLVWACADSYGATGSGLAGQLRALLADRDRLDAAWRAAHADGDEQAAQRWELRRQLRETRADLDAALVTIRALQDELTAARTSELATAQADALEAIAASYHTGINATAYDMHRRARNWAADVAAGRRTIPPTDRSSDA